jgi:3-hydroxybutyrate dehydrogenase
MPSGTAPSPSSLAGRVAVVTGAGRGVGATIARHLASAGAAVMLAARTASEVEAMAGDLRAAGSRAEWQRCDVSEEADVLALARAVEDRLGHADILVNNAGIAPAAPIEKTTRALWDRVFAINATGAFLCTKVLLPGMVACGWGRIVNVASIAGLSGDKYISAYVASKHAMVGFTRAVAAEVADKRVTVNAVCPGYLDTDMTRRSIDRIVESTGRTREAALDAILRTTPQRRLIGPDEVAATVLFLCSEAAHGITGASIVIDGGQLRR